MINLNLKIDGENKMIEVPTKWEDITVDQYQKIIAIDLTDSENDSIKQFNIRQEQFCILTGITIDILELFSMDDFNSIEKNFEFMRDEMKGEIQKSIIIEGEEYHLYTEFEKLTVGEQFSIDIITKESNGDLLKVYTKLLCLFLRKKNEDGTFETFKTAHMNRESMFGKLPIVTVNSLMVFFSNGEII